MPKTRQINGKELVARIEARGKEFGYASLKATCMAAGATYESVRNWGRTDIQTPTPKRETLKPLLKELNTTEEWLLFGEGAPDATETTHAIPVPLLGHVAAGRMTSGDSLAGEAHDIIQVAGIDDGELFALRIIGDSMDRILPEETIVIVDRADRTLIALKIFVIADPETGDATVKRYMANPPRFEAWSHSPGFTPLPASNVKVLGRVRMSLRLF